MMFTLAHHKHHCQIQMTQVCPFAWKFGPLGQDVDVFAVNGAKGGCDLAVKRGEPAAMGCSEGQ